MTPGEEKAIGVIIPAFGHPKFLPEAIISACEQEIDQPVKVVVVDDGCRFQETADTVLHLQGTYSDKLFYLRQENTRLPGARNTGIRFFLELGLDMDAFFFLDADNRLSPYSLRAYREALGDDPSIGWAYPDITFFGLTSAENGMETRETAPEYNRLKHLVSNISEAGSMVRAEMVHRGVRFDETMTSGFEDWDFWLSALEAGFQGVRAENTDFLYRVRPESMLAESQRIVDSLVATIRDKHKPLFQPSNILSWENEDAPTFAIYRPGLDTILMMSDPLAQQKEVLLEDFNHLFQSWAHNYFEHFFPTHIIVVADDSWKLLQKRESYLRWFFWQLRSQDNQKQVVSLKAGDLPSFEFLPYGGETEQDCADIFCVNTQLVWKRAHSDEPAHKSERSSYWADVFLGFTDEDLANKPVGEGLEEAFESLVESLLPVPQYRSHASQKFSGPHSASVRELLIPELCANEGAEPFPACCNTQRTMLAVPASALNLPGGFGRVGKIIETLALPDVELVLLLEHAPKETVQPSCYKRLRQLFTDIIPFCLMENNLDAPQYLGKRFKKHLTYDQLKQVSLLSRTCGELIAIGATSVVEAFGDVRRHGSKTTVFFDESLFRTVEELEASKTKLLAYEHAIGRIVIDNPTILSGLAAEGFPSEKIEPAAESGANVSKASV